MLLNFSLNQTKPRVGLQGWGSVGFTDLKRGRAWVDLAACCPPRSMALSPFRYHLVVFVLIYFLPLVVMFVAYSVIGLTLWKRAVPRHQAHGANLRHLQAKKKVRRGSERAGPPGVTWAPSLPARGQRGAHNPGHSALQTSAVWTQSWTDFFVF